MMTASASVNELGRPDLHETTRDDLEVHVVPLYDVLNHEDGEFGVVCDCCPSVVPVRHGTTVGRVVVHHAQDGRASNDWVSAR